MLTLFLDMKPAASKWPTEVVQGYIEDFNSSNEKVDDTFRSRLHGAVSPEFQIPNAQNALFFPKDSHPYGGASDIDQLMRMDPHQFPSDMLVDSDVMSMWSAAPFQCV
jgi:hypothetical protein